MSHFLNLEAWGFTFLKTSRRLHKTSDLLNVWIRFYHHVCHAKLLATCTEKTTVRIWPAMNLAMGNRRYFLFVCTWYMSMHNKHCICTHIYYNILYYVIMLYIALYYCLLYFILNHLCIYMYILIDMRK